MSASANYPQIYQKFFQKCLLTRTPVERFEKYIAQLLSKFPIQSGPLCAELISPSLSSIVDPLHLQYIQRLAETDIVSIPDVLIALLRTSPSRAATSTSPAAHNSNDDTVESGSIREMLEQDILLVLANVAQTQKKLRSADTIWTAIKALSDWMEAVMAASGTSMLDESGGGGIANSSMGNEGKGRREALAELIIALGNNEDVLRILGEGGRKERKLMFQTSLSLFTQYIQVQNQPLGSRLESLFRQQQNQQSPQQGRGGPGRNGKGAGSGDETIDGMMMGLGDGDVAVGPVVWGRGAIFVWINGLLTGTPHVYDETIIGYLNSRYKDDRNNLLIDFITSVLDAISNAVLRNEPAVTLFLLRSFLTNKVPLLLARLSPSPMVASYVLSQSLLRTDASTLANLTPSSFDPYSHNTGANPDMFFNGLPIDLRQELLFACALHGVVSEGDIQEILGELPLGALPDAGKYEMDQLISQCSNDPDRIDKLLEEIEGIEGNSGAVVLAVVELMRNMCEQKETMPLRSICNFLTRKTSSLDVMLLFVKPAYILEPLCELLDTWRYDEDQGEYQPVYEEFGYILLLVLTLIHRYDLSLSDIISSPHRNIDSFVPQLILKGSSSQRIDNLESSDRHAQLGGWIKEIFEGEGISDGLMSSCRPQDFYRLVPTLFMQSVLACERGVLELDTLKEGFAYLLEPFLLPSLVGGLGWLANHLWESHDDISIPLQILHSLLIVPNISPEVAEVHRTAVSISSRQLQRVLRETVRRGTAGAQQALAEQIIATLHPYTIFKRTGAANKEELENWTQHSAGGGLLQSVSTMFQSLVSWSTGDINSTRPTTTYTHRLLLSAWKILGAKAVVKTIVGEVVKCRIPDTLPGYAEDLAVNMILSNIPGAGEDGGGRFGLLDALRAEEEDLRFGVDGIRAEVIRVLLKKIGMQMMPYSPIPQHASANGAGAGGSGHGAGGSGLDMAGGDAGGVNLDGVDLNMGDDGMAGLLGDGGLGDGDLMAGGLLEDVGGMI
ncbi:mediator complex subunit [Rhizina undulata]